MNEYPHGGYPLIHEAIAEYAGVEPENVVLGAGADDLLFLVARAFAGPGDTVAIPPPPTYPLFRDAVLLAGAEVGDESPVMTFCCRPANPTGELVPLPSARPLVVDEAYFEYAQDAGAVGLIDDGVVVVRTFSKIFALAGARIGYALASRDVAAELNARQPPAQVSTLSVALALAALASPPDVAPVVEERERLASELLARGYAPVPSRANFLYVPVDEPRDVADRLLAAGCVVRVFADAIRISVRDREDDDLLLAALTGDPPPQERRSRHVRTTTETSVSVRLALDGASRVRVSTGTGLYDHFLEQLAFHAGFDLVLEGSGDLETGDHHTAEDAAIALGEAFDRRSATARASRATGTQSSSWTTRAQPLLSTSVAARIRGSSSIPRSALRRTCWRASRTMHASACTSSPAATTNTTSPRRRTRRPAARCGPQFAPRATCFPRRRA